MILRPTLPKAFASQPPSPMAIQADAVAQARAARRTDTTLKYAEDAMVKRSKDSGAMLTYWDKVDTIIDGIDGMRLAGTAMMPRFNDEVETDYQFRLQQTKMSNVYSDIIEGLASKPFEEAISLIKGATGEETAPQSILDFVQDVDGSGNTITAFANETFFNGINAAIDWIFVDFSKPDDSIRTLADAKRAGVRPYWSHVLGRNVLDVLSEVIGGKETLTYMKIFEPGEPDRIREFTRHADGKVTWILYEYRIERAPNTNTNFVPIENGDISIGEIPLRPLVTGRRMGRSWYIRPAMKAAAELQVELYQQESALKYAKVLTAFPMLAANGIAPPKGPDGKTAANVAVGPNRVLWSAVDVSTGRAGTWAYVEPNSESLKFLSDEIDKTIRQLRELGRQPLTAQSDNITVITAAVAASKAKSAVKAWAYMLKNTLEECLLLTAKWMTVTYDPIVHVFTDFDEYMEGQDLDALNAARDRNDISQETYWEEYQRRSVLSSNFTPARERMRLLNELPGSGPDNLPAAG